MCAPITANAPSHQRLTWRAATRQQRLLDQRPFWRSVAGDYRGGRRCVDEGLAPAAPRSAGPGRRATGHHRLRPRRLEPEVARHDDQGRLRLADLSQGPLSSTLLGQSRLESVGELENYTDFSRS